MDKQIALDVISNLPDDILMEDIIETLNLIKEINKRVENFDRTRALTIDELKKELEQWK